MHSFLSFYVYLFIQISCNNKEELKQHVVQTDVNNIWSLIGPSDPHPPLPLVAQEASAGISHKLVYSVTLLHSLNTTQQCFIVHRPP